VSALFSGLMVNLGVVGIGRLAFQTGIMMVGLAAGDPAGVAGACLRWAGYGGTCR
jgi:formate hydrogenlyase subunit 3/multisubunit Na+/H+ antiporter MnhD subunit